MDNPRVSVIIPIFNGENYLAESIASVLNQSFSPHEIIIIDDGSTDTSANIAQSFGDGVSYYFQPTAGIAAARNKGVEKANGDYLAFLDCDDLWTKDKLSLQIAAFKTDPSLDIAFGHLEQFVSPELDEETKEKSHCPDEIIAGIHCGTMLIKQDAFNRVGLFETQFEIGEFVSWYIRAKELNLSIKVIPELVMRRRIHGANTVIQKRQSVNNFAHIIKRSLDRRRENQDRSTP